MEHSMREESGTAIIAFSGDIDLESSPVARKVLLDSLKDHTSLMVDLSGVDYIDSSGVASLVETLQTARAGGGEFALVSVSDAAMRVLQLARLDKVFTIHGSIEDGLADGV